LGLHLSLAIFDDVQLDTLALGDGHKGGASRSNDEDVGKTSGKLVANSVLQVNDIVASRVLLASFNNANSPQVVSTSDHCEVSDIKGNVSNDGVALQGELDGVLDLDQGIGVADGATIVGDEVRDLVLSHSDSNNLAELELGLICVDAVDVEATLSIIEETEVLSSLWDAHHIHESDGVASVSADLAIHGDEALSGDEEHLASSQGVLETVSQENDHRDALAVLVGTRGRLGRPDSGEFVQHPVVRGIQSLEMLLGSASLF
jgi:hypothetical protein